MVKISTEAPVSFKSFISFFHDPPDNSFTSEPAGCFCKICSKINY